MRLVRPIAPVKLTFKTPFVLFVTVLEPAKAVVVVIVPVFENVLFTVSVAVVNVPLFDTPAPEIVMAVKALAKLPLIVFEAPEKVYVPVPGLNVPLLKRLPAKVRFTTAAVLLKVPSELIVRFPLKALVPVAEEIVKVPVTEVVPVTVKVNAAAVKVVPVPIVAPPVTAKFAAVA